MRFVNLGSVVVLFLINCGDINAGNEVVSEWRVSELRSLNLSLANMSSSEL